jgi:hypothetical protein
MKGGNEHLNLADYFGFSLLFADSRDGPELENGRSDCQASGSHWSHRNQSLYYQPRSYWGS